MHSRIVLYSPKSLFLSRRKLFYPVLFFVSRSGPPFAAWTASTVLGRVPTRFRSVFYGDSILNTTGSDLCIALDDVWLECSCLTMENISWSFLPTVLKLIWRSHQQKVGYLFALCALAFAEPRYFVAELLPFPNITIQVTFHCGIFTSKEISWLFLLHRWNHITVLCWNSLSYWEWPILSQKFAKVHNFIQLKIKCLVHLIPII